MSGRLLALLLVAAAGATLASAGAAGPIANKQRVAITAKRGVYSFVLTPLRSGSVRGDSGDASWGNPPDHTFVRDGQTIDINEVNVALTGARGTMTIHFHIEWVNAGGHYIVGTGTWKVLGGTGAYAHIAGGGRSAHAWLPRGPVSWRAEGFLSRT
jgi:hypothetical protein